MPAETDSISDAMNWLQAASPTRQLDTTMLRAWKQYQAAERRAVRLVPAAPKGRIDPLMAKYKRLEERRQAVREAWDRIEDAEPDISTERLLAMVAEDTGEDYGDVAALREGEDPEKL